jgi:biopolymer transport protein TolR
MGISTGGSKTGKANSEINVTPLVDVVLVLLIIFLVTMPIMMKQVTLEVPRKADEQVEDVSQMGDQITILVKADMSIVVNNGHKDTTIQAIDLAKTLRPMLDAKKVSEKLVFVDYCNSVAWGDVVTTMDSIRSIATDKNHDDVKVALKMRKKDAAGNELVGQDGCPPSMSQQ